jgi:hypothetical protein
MEGFHPESTVREVLSWCGSDFRQSRRAVAAVMNELGLESLPNVLRASVNSRVVFYIRKRQSRDILLLRPEGGGNEMMREYILRFPDRSS